MPVELVFAWFMIMIRGAAFLLLLPGLTGATLPPMVRMALAVGIATLVAPLVPAGAAVPSTIPLLVAAIAGEVVLGTMMGFVGRMAFYAVEMAGRIISTEIGLTATPGVDSPTASSEPLPAFLFRFAVLLYFLCGGHLLAVAAFARSLQHAPPGLALTHGVSTEQLIDATGSTIAAGVQLAAPFIAINFLVTLAFGLLGRTVSKINVFMLSLSARLLIGLTFLSGAGVLIARYLLVRFDRVPFDMLHLLPALR